VAVTQDGQRAISIEHELLRGWYTLHVWDVASGVEIASWSPDPGVVLSRCWAVPTDASLIMCTSSLGGIIVLRLLEEEVTKVASLVPDPAVKRRRFGLLKR
jgi:hypothetical protein